MINKIVQSMADAMAGIKDGSTVLIGGFGAVGQPDQLIEALIEQGANLQVQLANGFRLAALLALPDLGGLNAMLLGKGVEDRVGRPSTLVRAVAISPPLVEPLLGRQPAVIVAEMPLTKQGRRVARIGEQIGDRVLPRRQTALTLTGKRHLVRAGPNRLAAGQERRPRRSALRLNGVVVESSSLRSELVDPRGRGPTSVAGEVTPAGVIAQDEDDVWLLRIRFLCFRHLGEPPDRVTWSQTWFAATLGPTLAGRINQTG